MSGLEDDSETLSLHDKLDRLLGQVATINNRLTSHDAHLARLEKQSVPDESTDNVSSGNTGGTTGHPTIVTAGLGGGTILPGGNSSPGGGGSSGPGGGGQVAAAQEVAVAVQVVVVAAQGAATVALTSTPTGIGARRAGHASTSSTFPLMMGNQTHSPG
jgi:hypothetical protein